MNHHPTPPQALLLFGLLARHGECAQADLMPAVKKADREALAKARLIDVGRIGRGMTLALADAGWAWTAAHLDAELPSAQRALADMLARLGDHLAKTGGTLADFIGGKPEARSPATTETRAAPPERRTKATAPARDTGKAADAKPSAATVKASAKPKAPTSAALGKRIEAAPSPATGKARAKNNPPGKQIKAAAPAPRASKAKTSTKPKAPTPAALRKRIEAAYLALTGGRKDETVRLAQLRGSLPDLDRSTVDAALGRILQGDGKASLMRYDDPGQLDQADHDAAFNPSGEPFHVIWIAS